MKSRRQLLLEAVFARLCAIKTRAGFQTDVGLEPDIEIGSRPELTEDDPDVVIAIILGDEEPNHIGANVGGTTPIELQALAKADLEAPYLSAEAVLSDIKAAIELEDRSIGGLARPRIERGVTRTIPREPGVTTVGISITYLAPFAEAWGRP